MKRLLIQLTSALVLVAWAGCLSGAEATPPSVRWHLTQPDNSLRLSQLDIDKLLAEDQANIKNGQPAHYAAPRKITPVRLRHGQSSAGRWLQVASDRWVWQLRVQAQGASTIDLGFSQYWLPAGAALYVYDKDRRLVRGPFTDRHNKAHGQLWTPLVPGDEAIVELEVSATMRPYVKLQLSQVNHGFRFLRPATQFAGSCNIDVICPEGDAWREQIRAVAAYGLGFNGAFCSGQMINNTRQDNTPYFLTANHCGISALAAPSLTVFWNFESPECRMPGSPANGIGLDIRDFTDTQQGATLVADSAPGARIEASDFALLRLDQAPPQEYQVFWAGWDRRGLASDSATAIHHPSGDEKRISFTDQALLATGYAIENGGGDTHWRVRAWSLGTTEPGSSGSGLFNPDGRLIGTLSGGFASCSSNPATCTGGAGACDWYGRFSQHWDLGQSAERRLRDWLDPDQSEAEFIDGRGTCDAPSVAISNSANPVRAGQTEQLFSQVGGGQPPYRYAWDIDGDGAVDSSVANPQFNFADAAQASANLTVTDAAGCSASSRIGLVVQAPRIEALSTLASQQQCGDGDNLIEPGETWAFNVELANQGDAPANQVSAVFAASENLVSGGPDAFGYTFADSDNALCAYQYVDIANSGSVVEVSGNDDGAGIVDLEGPGVPFYGSSYNQLVMSTNGYLATSLDDDGGDFDNDCNLPVPPQANFISQTIDYPNSGRLAVYHDDLLLTESSPVYQYFASCPRPADVGNDQACHVFQWLELGFFASFGIIPSFQAILYEQSGELVFQYPEDSNLSGNSATIGIQSPSADSGLQYACDQAAIKPNSAVCFFRQPPQQQGLNLVSGTTSLGALNVDERSTATVVVHIDETAACGSNLSVDFLGAAHQDGFSNSPQANALRIRLAGEGCSNTSAMCSLDHNILANPPIGGFWHDPQRPGSRVGLHFDGQGMYGNWYTADAARNATWYALQTNTEQSIQGTQVSADVVQLNLTGPIGLSTPAQTPIGRARFDFLAPDHAIMTWQLDQQRGGQQLRLIRLDEDSRQRVATRVRFGPSNDQYINPTESGWGLSLHQQGRHEIATIWVYDIDGLPRWVASASSNALLNQGQAPLQLLDGRCPACVWVPPQAQAAGTLRRSLDGNGGGRIDLNIDIGGRSPIEWQRNRFSIQRTTPPIKPRIP